MMDSKIVAIAEDFCNAGDDDLKDKTYCNPPQTVSAEPFYSIVGKDLLSPTEDDERLKTILDLNTDVISEKKTGERKSVFSHWRGQSPPRNGEHGTARSISPPRKFPPSKRRSMTDSNYLQDVLQLTLNREQADEVERMARFEKMRHEAVEFGMFLVEKERERHEAEREVLLKRIALLSEELDDTKLLARDFDAAIFTVAEDATDVLGERCYCCGAPLVPGLPSDVGPHDLGMGWWSVSADGVVNRRLCL